MAIGEGSGLLAPRWETAASWLFVPGDRGERFGKAAASGADMVILDLEDAVAPDAKAGARRAVARWLAGGGSACVRVNAASTASYREDLAALAGCGGVSAVMVPKAEDPADVVALRDRLPEVPVIALVETAVGVDRARDLADAVSPGRLAFGSVDFALDIGATEDELPLLLARSSLVLAARLGGLPAPLDGVTRVLDDPEILAGDARRGLALGFGGKLCIHPRQVPVVNDIFTPGADEVARARQLIAAAAGGGARSVDGQMVDRPIVERAKRVLARADQAVRARTERPGQHDGGAVVGDLSGGVQP